MKRYIKLYFHYLSMALKSKLMYRADWALSLFGLVISNGFAFLTLYLSMKPLVGLNGLDGWTFEHIVFLYGFMLIPMGIDHMFTDRLWNYGGFLINNGELDRILMKPINPLFQMCAEYFQEGGLGEAILGIVFISVFGPQLNVSCSLFDILPIVIGSLFAPLIYFAIKLFLCSIAFYTKRSISLMSLIYNFKEYGKYPLSIYTKLGNTLSYIIYNVLIFILPFGLVGYLPLARLFFKDRSISLLWFSLPAESYTSFIIMGLTIIISLLVFVAAYAFFKKSLKHYSSSGS